MFLWGTNGSCVILKGNDMITQQFKEDLKALYAIHKINQHIKAPLSQLVEFTCDWLSTMETSSKHLDRVREEYSKELENVQGVAGNQLNIEWEKQIPERKENG